MGEERAGDVKVRREGIVTTLATYVARALLRLLLSTRMDRKLGKEKVDKMRGKDVHRNMDRRYK